MRVAIGCDHAGFSLKSLLVEHLEKRGYQIVDVGTHAPERCD
ncbi:MAG: RpiB/LacA/LacB family sugar-phosphate isomerase, partial [Myxococcota bacterium]|nr:RpiB/LacA/LacB family sugar-phosphate isomerase [Myxococcota bacterium]MEC8425127.1 RpiB/LacA/LacB family sugar-phosphate isomerase [Myxococcota bacterium]